MPHHRSLRHPLVLASVLVSFLLVASAAATAAPSRGPGPRTASLDPGRVPFGRVHDAVASGRLSPDVVRQLHRTGHADALLVLGYRGALAAAGTGTVSASELRLAFEPTKADVLGRLAGVRLLRDYDVLPLMLVRFSSEAALLDAVNDPSVVGVREDGKKEPILAQSLPLIRQPTAAASGYTGAGTAVAVLDTGVDHTRAAFGSCSSPGVPAGCSVVYAQDFATNDGSLDDNGHGTNVAGIVVGVAPSTKILALDVFGPGGTGSDTDILAAVNFTVANQATYNVRAMNLSLGDGTHNTSTCSGSSYAAAFASARAVGILPVVASGNDAYIGGVYVNGISDPGCAPGAVSVGAVYDGNNGGLIWGTVPDTCTDPTTAADQITCFSQSVSFLTVLAPGAMITAAGITQGGTSQATPHVAGAVAVLAAKNPAATIDTITSSIANSGPLLLDARNGVSKHRFDLPDAAAAVGSPPPPPTISSFTPTSGPVGTPVVITGTDLTGATSVTFGGVAAVSFTVNSATQITATVPSGAVTGQIGATTPSGTGMSAGSFTVTGPPSPSISSFTPTSGPSGTSVVITGTNLTGATSVTFGGVAASFAVDSPTQITATVPGGAVTGPITVATSGGSATSIASFTVTGPPQHARSVSFRDAGRVAKGRVRVADGFGACASSVPIKLQYRAGGRWRTADTGTTSLVGRFRASLVFGLYRVLAKKITLASGDVCLKAVSPKLRW